MVKRTRWTRLACALSVKFARNVRSIFHKAVSSRYSYIPIASQMEVNLLCFPAGGGLLGPTPNWWPGPICDWPLVPFKAPGGIFSEPELACLAYSGLPILLTLPNIAVEVKRSFQIAGWRLGLVGVARAYNSCYGWR